MTARGRTDVAVAAVLDVVAILLFVVLGRRSHDEGSAIGGTLRVAGPFLIALAIAWAATRAWRPPVRCVPRGVMIWAITVVVGLVLRRTVFDRGTALSFVIVATIVLGVFLIGWRAVARQLRSGS